MERRMKLKGLVWASLMLCAVGSSAQVTQLNNTVTLGTQYLGCDNLSNQSLRLTTTLGYPIEFRTNATLRMRMNHNLSQNINGTGFLSRNGFLGLSGNSTFFAGTAANPGPFSRLHLDDNANPLLGTYRLWMKNGIYMSGNNDMMYVGQLYRLGFDESDAVVAWGDNAVAPAGPDHLRFLFMGNSGPEGLEVTRITGDGQFGIGDFNSAGVQPSERLHLYDGRLRIQHLPDDAQMAAQNPTQVMVVDNTALPSPEHGVVKWRDANNLDCKWSLTTGIVNHVYTAVGVPGVPCPDDVDAVGIGLDLSTTAPWAKLNVNTSLYAVAQEVRNTNANTGKVGVRAQMTGGTGSSKAFDAITTQGSAAGSDNRGISITATGNGFDNGNINYGLRADVTGGSRWTRGVSASTNGGFYTEYAGEFLSFGSPQYAYGTLSECYGGATIVSYGMRGTAHTNSPSNYGVVGNVTGTGPNLYVGVLGSAPVATNSWAIVSQGNQMSTTGPAWQPSDENLKTNIEDYSAGLEQLMLLRPKSYLYATETYGFMHLPTEPQVGFLAQDVAEVLPHLVRDVQFPVQYDAEGNQIAPAIEFKAMQPGSLIPLLVSAVQDLKQQNDALLARLTAVEASVAACCGNPTGDGQRMRTEDNVGPAGEERLLQIQPNPFNEDATLYYTLERSGRMQLLANSADGKQLRVLDEANREAGQYQLEWNTQDLSPGVYYVTLLLDGEPIVKKAVKVSR